MTLRSPTRYARQVSLAEIGTTGQARLESASVRAGSGDARACEVALSYLERAGVKLDAASGDGIDVRTEGEIAQIAGRKELVEAAAFLAGALAATDRIARIATAGVRAVTHVPSLAGETTDGKA